MAEMDKTAMLHLLQGMLGEEKAKEAGNLVQSLLEGSNEQSSLPSLPSRSDDLIDNAALMQELSGVMNGLRNAKNTKEAVLLSAIRPYLRPSRQPKIDSCLKILQAYQVFYSMKKSGKLP